VKFVWPEAAKAALRAIDRESAVRILLALTSFAETGNGDIKALEGKWQGASRLRVGDYRVILPSRARPNYDASGSGIALTFTIAFN
jgi:mRNA-degrading endonuclease RelE of RelBE toxin-antitoxin system